MQEQISAIQKLINTVIEYSVSYGFQVLGALIVLAAGFLAANWACGTLSRLFEKKKMDITLSGFLTGCVRGVILGFAVLIALGKFGITIAPFVAALGAATFGASFALQGPLSNYGAGLSIILSRPFTVGDTISVTNVSGVVKEVKLACTILIDEDGVKITIPNKDIVGQVIYNSRFCKVAPGMVGISYSSDPELAIRVIQDALAGFPEIASNPKPQIGIQEFADSSVNIAYRYWVPTEKYFQAVHAVNLAVYKAINKAGINIPFPQRDVRLVTEPSKTGR